MQSATFCIFMLGQPATLQLPSHGATGGPGLRAGCHGYPALAASRAPSGTCRVAAPAQPSRGERGITYRNGPTELGGGARGFLGTWSPPAPAGHTRASACMPRLVGANGALRTSGRARRRLPPGDGRAALVASPADPPAPRGRGGRIPSAAGAPGGIPFAGDPLRLAIPRALGALPPCLRSSPTSAGKVAGLRRPCRWPPRATTGAPSSRSKR